MDTYEDPNNKGNGAEYHTRKPCIIPGCTDPAGTAWSPFWCFAHNVERIRRITRQIEAIAKPDTRD